MTIETTSNDGLLLNTAPKMEIIEAQYLWEWDVFGGGELTVKLGREVSWLMRLRTRIFLGSKWMRFTRCEGESE